MPRIVVPRSAKRVFVSLFSAVPPLLAVDAARRMVRAHRADRAGWALMAGIHALPGAYIAMAGAKVVLSAPRTSPTRAPWPTEKAQGRSRDQCLWTRSIASCSASFSISSGVM